MNLRTLGWSLSAVIAIGCTSSSAPNGSGSSSPTPAGGASTPSGPHACDPLAAVDTPLTLANLLGAGRHPDGTLYVVDDTK